mgnify:CR=1 FL=1
MIFILAVSTFILYLDEEMKITMEKKVYKQNKTKKGGSRKSITTTTNPMKNEEKKRRFSSIVVDVDDGLNMNLFLFSSI